MGLVNFAFAVLSLLQTPSLPQMAAPVAVDVATTSITWHPRGTALYYTRTNANGQEIGLYALGQGHGNIVLRLNKSDKFEAQWFENSPNALFIVYRDLPQTEKSAADVYLADAQQGTAQAIYNVTFPAKTGVELDVDPSPKLRHAIFRVKSGKQSFHMVLPNGGVRLIPSPDLDQAVKDGLSGPSWSVDGTAVYCQAGQVPIRLSGDLTNGSVNGSEVRFTVANETVKTISLDSFTFKLFVHPPPPPVGSAVLELMPSNAVLRQVRFKGAWEYPQRNWVGLNTVMRPVNVQWGSSVNTASSLWLVLEKDRSHGTLISPHAQQAWLAPMNQGVAYTVDGALFVRPFNQN